MTRLRGSCFLLPRPSCVRYVFVQHQSLSFPRCTQHSYLSDSTATKAAPAFLRRSLSLSTTKGQTALPIGDYRPSRSLSMAGSAWQNAPNNPLDFQTIESMPGRSHYSTPHNRHLKQQSASTPAPYSVLRSLQLGLAPTHYWYRLGWQSYKFRDISHEV